MLEISLNYVDGVEELWSAAYYGDVPKMVALLANPEFKARINHTMSLCHDHSPLFVACYGPGNAAAVRVLLDAGADPYQRDEKGRLPLHYAALSLVKEIIDVLLAVPNMKTLRLDDASANGLTPVHTMFLPSLDISQARKSDYSRLATCLDSMLEPDRKVSEQAMHKQDKNGLSSFMFVKHYGLAPWFPPQHTPPKAFQIFLKNIVKVPGHIAGLLASDLYCPAVAAISMDAVMTLFVEAQRARVAAMVFTAPPPPVQEQVKPEVIEVTKSEPTAPAP